MEHRSQPQFIEEEYWKCHRDKKIIKKEKRKYCACPKCNRMCRMKKYLKWKTKQINNRHKQSENMYIF